MIPFNEIEILYLFFPFFLTISYNNSLLISQWKKTVVISFLDHSKLIHAHFPPLFYNSSRFLPVANLTPTKGSLFDKGDAVNFKIRMASLFDNGDGEIKLAKRWPFIMRQRNRHLKFPSRPRYNTFAPFNFFTRISFHIFLFFFFSGIIVDILDFLIYSCDKNIIGFLEN